MLAAALLILAVDSLSGGSGWVGAGLLGAVLAWLLFVHLPGKDKQLKEMMDTKDKQQEDGAKQNKLLADTKDGQIMKLIEIKDNQMKELLAMNAAAAAALMKTLEVERAADRLTRHESISSFKLALDQQNTVHCDQVKTMQEAFAREIQALKADVQQDSDGFAKAITEQTIELKTGLSELKGVLIQVCKYRQA